MGPVDITLVLADFHKRHPQVELTVREDNSDALAEMLRVDALDLAFLSVTERVESHGLALQQILMEELVVVLPPDHRLAEREEIRMARTRGRRVHHLPRGRTAARNCLPPPPIKPASSHGSSLNPTRAGEFDGSCRAGWGSRSCRARTRSTSLTSSRSRGWSNPHWREISRSHGGRVAVCHRPSPSSSNWFERRFRPRISGSDDGKARDGDASVHRADARQADDPANR